MHNMAVYDNCYMSFLILACGKQVGEQDIYNRGKVKLSYKRIDSLIHIHTCCIKVITILASLSLSIAPQAACKVYNNITSPGLCSGVMVYISYNDS